jgi:HPt (histidine-containing phosphotransfer) domain-containing protein
LRARLNGNRALVRRLASLLLTGYRELPAEMRDAIAAADAAQVRFLAHKLKSVFGELGLHGAREQAALAEAAGRSQDPGAGQRLAALVPVVDSVFEQARRFLDADANVVDQ